MFPFILLFLPVNRFKCMQQAPSYSRFTTEYRVRPDDIDMFQHVHNSRYFDYVLAARYDQMTQYYGMSMESFMEMGYGWVVRVAHVEYKRSLKMGDRFSVETGIVEMQERGCKVSFTLRELKLNKIVCTGWFDYVLIHLESGKSAKVTSDMMAHYAI